jgi:hypothetical protein
MRKRVLKCAWNLSGLRGSNRDEAALANCQEQATKEPEDERTGSWRNCVERLVPQTIRLPRERFSLPEHGILSVTQGGYFEACFEALAFSLDDGLVVRRISCRRGGGRPSVRFDALRVDSAALRRAALLIAVAAEAQRSPAYAASFVIPPGFGQTDDQVGSLWSIGVSDSDTHEVRYELTGVLESAPTGSLQVHEQMEPAEELIGQLLMDLSDATQPSCLATGDVASFERLLEALVAGLGLENGPEVLAVSKSVRCH